MPEKISTTRARQGVSTGRVFLVLLISLMLAVVVGLILYFGYYFPMA